jgi:pimeloyl-ACP methyl ester carboxylesterase
MARLAARLITNFRVITYDQRGCGSSSAGPWTFDTALDDLHAVIKAHGLINPIVAGHSLGGLVAIRYGARHCDARAVVNIDGWGPGKPEQYVGEDSAAVTAFHDRAVRMAPHTLLGRVIDPALKRLPAVRKSRDMLLESIAAVREMDVLALHREVECPTLAFNCIAPMRGLTKHLVGAEGARLLRSYKHGLRRDLAVLVDERPNLTVIELDATHNVIATDPDLVAQHIAAFVGEGAISRAS